MSSPKDERLLEEVRDILCFTAFRNCGQPLLQVGHGAVSVPFEQSPACAHSLDAACMDMLVEYNQLFSLFLHYCRFLLYF